MGESATLAVDPVAGSHTAHATLALDGDVVRHWFTATAGIPRCRRGRRPR